jgi:hypothetical protein
MDAAVTPWVQLEVRVMNEEQYKVPDPLGFASVARDEKLLGDLDLLI